MHRTIKALMARGVDFDSAIKVMEKGFWLKDLQAFSNNDFIKHDIPECVKQAIKSKRPPIPARTVNELLSESRRTCCICRNGSASVVIHHIYEWSQSKSHDKQNLVVLCLKHHDEALRRDLL